MVYIVEAYTASWIEIRWATAPDPFTKRRSLYGFVDWNFSRLSFWVVVRVEAYTASWIEIHILKPPKNIGYVEAYTASWIEMISVNEHFLETRVEAYTASWIEILAESYKTLNAQGRSLYGFVDWNLPLWIRIFLPLCRSLYGFVDWNWKWKGVKMKCVRRSLYGFVDWNHYLPVYQNRG